MEFNTTKLLIQELATKSQDKFLLYHKKKKNYFKSR